MKYCFILLHKAENEEFFHPFTQVNRLIPCSACVVGDFGNNLADPRSELGDVHEKMGFSEGTENRLGPSLLLPPAFTSLPIRLFFGNN
jgi:hypothetical protein